MRVSASQRRVVLEDLSQVADIELRAGAGVGLSVGDIGELPRIRIIATDSGAGTAGVACTDAERAAAAAFVD